MNKDYFDQIRNLISKGKTEQALSNLNEYCCNSKSPLYSNFILLSNQFHIFKEKNILNLGEYNTEFAKIVNAILEFIKELEHNYLNEKINTDKNISTIDDKDNEINWLFVEKGIFELKERIIEENYYPSIIVGIGRGGAIIGALLSGCMGNIPILVLDRVYKWDNRKREDEMIGNITLNKNVDNVLLVAGELHTGNTAKMYIEYFEKLGASNIKILSFMKEKYPALEPDFWYFECEKPDVRFPWMLTKNYKRESLKKTK